MVEIRYARAPIVLLALFAGACERAPVSAPGADAVAIAPGAAGGRLYAQHCAECHGPQAQGHPDWQNAAAGGFVAAPPLDASGRLPQRTAADVVQTIKTGVRRNDIAVMPAWQGRLGDADIDAVLAWLLSQWPPAQAAAWRNAQAQPAAAAHPQ